MTGCVFWGATYCFAENPAVETLMRQMQEQEPTVFVSIPVKWMQLYDAIREQVDVGSASDTAILETTRRLTGGKLRWGISAAGYLDPDVFRFFQRQGIELLSGFGMTEATGGITMTPPGRYKDDSLGVPLPGIEIALAGDGELKIRGPYVMTGYLDPPEKEPAVDDEGWFHTGDLMEMDRDGEIRIVDRKKEIYKNVKGETVAPQRVENLFRDFDSVGRVFVVGDHREYNTALIYPNPESGGLDLAALSDHELKAHFGSLVVSANSFLAPFERIVDFAVIDRDFTADHGELTPKGTFRRKTVERNFSDLIRTLYRRARLRMGAVELLFPNWLFQTLGVTAQDLRVAAEKLTLASVGAPLTVRRKAPDRVQVGQVVYRTRGGTVDLGALLSTPRLWLGNEELVEFAPLEPEARQRRPALGIEWESRTAPFEASAQALQEASALLDRRELDLMDVHRAALLLESGEEPHAVLALRVFHRVLELTEGPVVEASRQVLRRASRSAATEVRRRAFQVLLPAEQPQRFRRTLASFLDAPGETLDRETAAVFVERGIPADCLDAFVEEAEERCLRSGAPDQSRAESGALLGFLADYGAAHPSSYRRLRAFVTRIAMVAEASQTQTAAAAAQRKLEVGFRSWLGPPSRIAVDPETGLEYRWSDVVAFAEDVEPEARERLLGAIESTPVLREAAFSCRPGCGSSESARTTARPSTASRSRRG